MEYFTPHNPNALPLWHHGRMFLSPTLNWAEIHTQNKSTYRVPLSTKTEAQALVDAAKKALTQNKEIPFLEKNALFQQVTQELKRYQSHFWGLLPQDFECEKGEWESVCNDLENIKEDENSLQNQVLALLPTSNFKAFFKLWKSLFFKNNAVIVKPPLSFSAFFLALAELTHNFPQDFFQVLLGAEDALKGLDYSRVDAFYTADFALKKRLDENHFQQSVIFYDL